MRRDGRDFDSTFGVGTVDWIARHQAAEIEEAQLPEQPRYRPGQIWAPDQAEEAEEEDEEPVEFCGCGYCNGLKCDSLGWP